MQKMSILWYSTSAKCGALLPPMLWRRTASKRRSCAMRISGVISSVVVMGGVREDTDGCVREALAHMDMLADVSRRGLDTPFADEGAPHEPTPQVGIDIPREDVPF